MMRLLFTCMGTSDPVRGYHDGPMLHIIRHYRPELICVFLSGEAAALDGLWRAAGHRFIAHSEELGRLCAGAACRAHTDR